MVKEAEIKGRTFVKPMGWWAIAIAIAGALATAGVAIYSLSRVAKSGPAQPEPSPVVATVEAVSAIGRLAPQGEVIRLSAPAQGFGAGARIDQLLVEEGTRVQAGQVIAILDTRPRLQASLAQAQSQVTVAQTRLAQVKAGAKQGDIEAQRANIRFQQATIARSEAEWRNAQIEYKRFQQLYQDGAVSLSQLDNKRLILETAQGQVREAKAGLNQARATLASVAEVRPTDVAAASPHNPAFGPPKE